jgi:hypothetical protein
MLVVLFATNLLPCERWDICPWSGRSLRRVREERGRDCRQGGLWATWRQWTHFYRTGKANPQVDLFIHVHTYLRSWLKLIESNPTVAPPEVAFTLPGTNRWPCRYRQRTPSSSSPDFLALKKVREWCISNSSPRVVPCFTRPSVPVNGQLQYSYLLVPLRSCAKGAFGSLAGFPVVIAD